MKKLKKLFRKLNNDGSSLVMVIVALAFIGIIVGALLTAVGYSYRLKLQDLNSRDNFYYVEQAMNEIYAGVGSEVVGDMQDAYAYTVENMLVYDFETKAYIAKPDDQVQDEFATHFMQNVQNNQFLTNANIADTLESYITNDSVKLDRSKLYVQPVREDPNNPHSKLIKIVIKNVTLTRTQEYDKNLASGAYTQTISTDIEIGEPDFNVLFNSTTDDYANIFKYSMVADMGIEVSQPSDSLVIAGNIYAAADYYNKKYNESTYVVDENGQHTVSDKDKKFVSGRNYDVIVGRDDAGNEIKENESADKYTHGSVTSKMYSPSATLNQYYNQYSSANNPAVAGSNDYYDGVLERSMYSGFFVEGTDVTVMADLVIVPGTVAVMDEGSFSLYGKNGSVTAKSELWADNIVLGGSSDKKIDADTNKPIYTGSSAIIKADAYVKDDTELNASGSNFSLNGRYFGYGDSTERDAREFVPTVDANNFQIKYTGGAIDNRGHYNSSAIIVNGQQSTLDLERTETIYLAGRSYIELSKDVTVEETTTGTGANAKTTVSETYSFLPETNNFVTTNNANDTEYLRDYKTGESISLKTNQLAYIPVMYTGMPEPVYSDSGVFAGYFEAELHVALKDSALFEKYFPKAVFQDYKIPCVMQEVSGRKYYYYDFETAYIRVSRYTSSQNNLTNFTNMYPSAQYYASAFIVDYVAELKDEDSLIAEHLTNIGDFEELEFDAGSIKLPDPTLNSAVNIYSSGAITTKLDTEFEIIQSSDWNPNAISSLLSSTNGQGFNNGLDLGDAETSMNDAGYYQSAYALSNDLELEYNLVKWNLGHYDTITTDWNKKMRNINEVEYIKALVQDADYGEASITPINKFLNMDVIESAGDITPSGINLSSGYQVWVTDDDVTISTNSTDKTVRGIVVTKGDVFFDESVDSFEGLIVSGGKVFITKNLKNMYSSPAICQAILRECQLLGTEDAKTILNLFKGYEVDGSSTGGSTPVASPTDPSNGAKTIDSIDYSDVCRFSNWMKNVE